MAMPAPAASDASPARLDFGPSLPVLLQRRFGIRERVTRIVALVVAALIGLAVVFALLSRPEQIVYRGGPTFNIQYSSDVLHRGAPQRGELVRLEAHKGKLSASITISRLRLPPYPGNVTSGLLPVYVDGYERELGRTLPGFQLRDEGSARVSDAQGYQVGFRFGPQGRFTWARDMLLVPGDEHVREGVVLRLRQTKVGTITKADQDVLDDVRKSFRSFNFGTDRGKW
jgi:hypothetical protein